LSALLLAHGLTMNGGVVHATEAMTREERDAATSGYRFFGYGRVAELFAASDAWSHEEERELRLNAAYAAEIPDDESLYRQFEAHFTAHHELYAPAPHG
jgi:hypothetical protein